MSEPIGYPPVLPPPAPARGPATWIAPLALVISLLAAVAAGWALLKPAPAADGGNPAVADPTGQICSAFFLVSNGVALQTRLNVGTDPSAQQAIAANARLAMSSGADYLRTKLASNTPAELAEPIATFADQLQTIAQYYLAGENNDSPAQAARLKDADVSSKTIAGLCKS